jgi:hypothetical protein
MTFVQPVWLNSADRTAGIAWRYVMNEEMLKAPSVEMWASKIFEFNGAKFDLVRKSKNKN